MVFVSRFSFELSIRVTFQYPQSARYSFHVHQDIGLVLSMEESQNPAIPAALRRRYNCCGKNCNIGRYLPLRQAPKAPCISAIAAIVPLIDNTVLG